MKDADIQLLKSVCKDPEAFEKARTLFDRLIEEKDQAVQQLGLLEATIKNDYDAIVITDLDMENPTIVYVNDGFEQMTGYKREEAIGQTPKLLQGPKTDRKILDRLKKSLIEGRSFFGQAVNYRKDGSEFVNQWDIHPLINNQGEITHWVSYQQDITERKNLEKSIRITESDQDNIRESCSRTLVDFAEDGYITYANNAFLSLTGYRLEELNRYRIWDLMPSSLNNLSNNQFEALWNNDIPIKTFTTLLKHKNGLPVQVEIHLETVVSNKSKVFRANIENVTLRKKVFKTLQKRNADYKRLISKKSDFKYGLTLDEKGRPCFNWLSEGFRNITGFNPEDCSTPSAWNELIHPDDISKVKDYLKNVRDGRSACSEYRVKTTEGRFRRVLDYARVDEDDKNAIRGSIVDITMTEQ